MKTNTCTAMILRPTTQLAPATTTALAQPRSTKPRGTPATQTRFFREHVRPLFEEEFEYSKLIDQDARDVLRKLWREPGYAAAAERTPRSAARRVVRGFKAMCIDLGVVG